jgi:2-dehydro-3-deoxyphosphogluconate aldolase/(4S)-4-hydroxy-2-oxoglutarate aldolase
VSEFLDFDGLFATSPVMAILRGYGPARSVRIASIAWSVGITCIEIPMQNAVDQESLAVVADVATASGHFVGVGTVLDPAAVDRAHALGARFTVSPGFDPEVARASLDRGMPHLPGVATASEVHQARKFGLHWLKAFPAADLGASWITNIRAPFPDVRIVATGGISAQNARQFLDAGAAAVAVGSALSDPEQLPELASLARPK